MKFPEIKRAKPWGIPTSGIRQEDMKAERRSRAKWAEELAKELVGMLPVTQNGSHIKGQVIDELRRQAKEDSK